MSKMKCIIAIGGGEIGRAGKQYETKQIDEEIVRLANIKLNNENKKDSPKLLFIGFGGKSYEDEYFEIIKNNFQKLGCEANILKYKDIANERIVKDFILTADIIYIGGGNTINLIRALKNNNIDKLLYKAYKKGTIMSGISAGAICWCKCGISDSRRYINDPKKYTRASGLDWIDIVLCPHYSSETRRQRWAKKIMKRTFKIPCIALDNGVALEIIDNKYKIIKSTENGNARKLYWSKGRYNTEVLTETGNKKELTNKTLTRSK